MAAKFNVSVSFSLETEIEPEGVRFDRYTPDSVSEFEENSYFQRYPVESDGGELTFVIEAESVEDAESQISEFISDGNEVEDDNGFTWLISRVSVDLEEIEEPMTLERAREILLGLAEKVDDEEVAKAAEFVLDKLVSLEARLEEATQRIAGLVTEVAAFRMGGTPTEPSA